MTRLSHLSDLTRNSNVVQSGERNFSEHLKIFSCDLEASAMGNNTPINISYNTTQHNTIMGTPEGPEGKNFLWSRIA